ncbi:unnamed protein product [Ranitomeya imitator]|uniref:RasGAP protein C-terminal domain-containing protein n=1 Tax=Ranitomeya imitator TaxID=111125 RepID=A0ABN9L2H1_9NEOB|nr:unnamed protein product [Ranitomeya imitator]
MDGKGEEKGSKKIKQSSLKYTAARLHEKGVILEIEGLQTNQFKNVLFDITPGDAVGDFEVKASFLGLKWKRSSFTFRYQIHEECTEINVQGWSRCLPGLMGVAVWSSDSYLHSMTSSSCLLAAALAQAYFVCPVEPLQEDKKTSSYEDRRHWTLTTRPIGPKPQRDRPQMNII